MAPRVHSGARLPSGGARPGARLGIFPIGKDLLFGGHQVVAPLFDADARAREITLSATLRSSFARLELR